MDAEIPLSNSDLRLQLVPEAQLLDLQNPDAAGGGGVELHRRGADLRAACGEFFAQLHERGDTSLVAGGARLDAAANPRLFLRELLRLALPVDGFVRHQLRLALHERRIVTLPA